ncbi:nucleotidyltransferase family protein [Oceanithermus profundus]
MAVKVDYRQELRSRLPELRARYGVKRLFLFGSRARGDARAESDLDLLVEFERVPTLFDLVRLERELADDLGVRVQVVTPGAIKPPLRPAVERDLAEV